MQVADYQRRIEEAADVLSQAPGNATGDSAVAEATRAVAEAS
jgi:hypothetical protein